MMRAAGPEPILQRLLDAGISIRAAWVPDLERPGPCQVFVSMTQLIVRLEQSNGHMPDYGFTQNPDNIILGECNPDWLEYDFRR